MSFDARGPRFVPAPHRAPPRHAHLPPPPYMPMSRGPQFGYAPEGSYESQEYFSHPRMYDPPIVPQPRPRSFPNRTFRRAPQPQLPTTAPVTSCPSRVGTAKVTDATRGYRHGVIKKRFRSFLGTIKVLGHGIFSAEVEQCLRQCLEKETLPPTTSASPATPDHNAAPTGATVATSLVAVSDVLQEADLSGGEEEEAQSEPLSMEVEPSAAFSTSSTETVVSTPPSPPAVVSDEAENSGPSEPAVKRPAIKTTLELKRESQGSTSSTSEEPSTSAEVPETQLIAQRVKIEQAVANDQLKESQFKFYERILAENTRRGFDFGANLLKNLTVSTKPKAKKAKKVKEN